MSPIPNGVSMAGLLPENADYVAGATVMRLGLVQGRTAPTLEAGFLPIGQEFRFQSFPYFPFFLTSEVAYADWGSLVGTDIHFSPPLPAEIAQAIEDSRDTSDEGQITQGDPDIPIRWLGDGLDFSISFLAMLKTTANNEFEAMVRFTELRDSLHDLSSDDLAVIPAVGASQIYSLTDWSYEVYANRPETVTLQLSSTRLITVPVHQQPKTTEIPDDSLFLSSVVRINYGGQEGFRYAFFSKPGYTIPVGTNEYHGKPATNRINTIVADVFYKAMASGALAKVATVNLNAFTFIGNDAGTHGWVYISSSEINFAIDSGISGLPAAPYNQANLTPTDGQEGFYWLRVTDCLLYTSPSPRD